MHPAPFASQRPPFRIKICGVKTPQDVEAAVACGADAIGVNFYPKSVRYVGDAVLRDLEFEATCVGDVAVVGVFVNEPVESILARLKQTSIHIVQTHGDESPAYHATLWEQGLRRTQEHWPSASHPEFRTMRAFRVAPGELAKVEEYLAECGRLGATPDAMLVDGFSPTAYGGVGERADWAALADWRTRVNLPPLILAGGLTPENVGAAIRAVRPAGVDVASGVESAPGVKSPERIAAFVSAAKRAFAEIGD